MPSRDRKRRLTLIAAAAGCVLGGGDFAGSASATVAAPGDVRAGHSILVIPSGDFVAAFGPAPGVQTNIDVFRGPHLIARSAGPMVDIQDINGATIGALETNHGPAGAPEPGDCWTQVTPDLKPGDRAVVSDAGGTDTVVMDDLSIDSITVEPGTDDVLLNGHARRGTDGSPLDVTIWDSAEWRFNGANRGALDPGTGITSTDGNGGYEARYAAAEQWGTFRGAVASGQNVADADHEIGFGHAAPINGEGQLVGSPAADGPALGCEGVAPAAGPNAITASDDEFVNLASDTLVLGGTTDGTIGNVVVSLSDGTHAPVLATVAGPDSAGPLGDEGFSAEFSRADLMTLDDGPLTATATFNGGPATATWTIEKDVVAPPAPAGTPAPGTYAGQQFVSLASPTSVEIRYSLDGGPQQVFGEPVGVGLGSHTIDATATDAAGNPSAPASLAYTITEPQQSPPASGNPGAGGAGVGTGAGGAGAGSPAIAPQANPFVQVSRLRTRSRLRLRSARRSGVRVAFLAPDGARVVKVELFRSSGRTAQLERPVGTATVALRRSGRHAIRLSSRSTRRALRRGLYTLRISAGASEDAFSLPVGKRIRIVR